MATARAIAGPERVLAGNVDPMVLLTSAETREDVIRAAVADCIRGAGGRKHVMNLGHGVEKITSEEAVAILVDATKSFDISSLN